jgi:hypothetical protein
VVIEYFRTHGRLSKKAFADLARLLERPGQNAFAGDACRNTNRKSAWCATAVRSCVMFGLGGGFIGACKQKDVAWSLLPPSRAFPLPSRGSFPTSGRTETAAGLPLQKAAGPEGDGRFMMAVGGLAAPAPVTANRISTINSWCPGRPPVAFDAT